MKSFSITLTELEAGIIVRALAILKYLIGSKAERKLALRNTLEGLPAERAMERVGIDRLRSKFKEASP